MNGTPTSFIDTFKHAYTYLSNQIDVHPDPSIWQDFGKYSSRLDVDEASDINKIWEEIASLMGKNVQELKQAISPVKDMYILLDHT